MTAQVAARRPAAVSQLAEIRRLRDQLAAALAERDQLAARLAALVAVGGTEPQIRLTLARELAADAWHRGTETGDRAGYERARAEMDAAWRLAADPVAHGGPALAELETLRWGPGGRARFADPCPGDFPGQVAS